MIEKLEMQKFPKAAGTSYVRVNVNPDHPTYEENLEGSLSVAPSPREMMKKINELVDIINTFLTPGTVKVIDRAIDSSTRKIEQGVRYEIPR